MQSMRKIPEVCYDLCRHFEQGPHGGPALASYADPGGLWTIGYGHTNGVKRGQTISAEDAEKFLDEDLNDAGAALCVTLEERVIDRLSDNRFASLVDFVFNLGIGRFERSTLSTVLHMGRMDRPPAEFMRWVRGKNGQVLAGLVARRTAEVELWNEHTPSVLHRPVAV